MLRQNGRIYQYWSEMVGIILKIHIFCMHLSKGNWKEEWKEMRGRLLQISNRGWIWEIKIEDKRKWEREREDKGRKGGKQEASNWQKEKNEKGGREGRGERRKENEQWMRMQQGNCRGIAKTY